MIPIRKRLFVTTVLVATICGCSAAPDGPTIPAASSAAITCRGVSRMPDVPGLPTAVFGTSLRLVATPGAGPSAATFDLRVDLPEESQHSDLPVGDPDVVLVFPVTATVESGQLSTIDGSDFRVFDAGGTACNSTEDPLGYTPLVGAELTAGASVSGILAHRMPRSLHDFTVVYFVSGVAAAVWR